MCRCDSVGCPGEEIMSKEGEANNIIGKAMGSFGQRALDGVLQHAVTAIVAVVGAFLAATYLLFKGWVLTEHTLTLPGWLWAIFLASYPLVLTAGLLLDVFWPLKYKEPMDIMNRLSIYVRRLDRDPLCYAEYTVHYRSLDRRYRLRRGSARKYLPEVAKEYGWEVTGIGQHTLRIFFNPDVSV